MTSYCTLNEARNEIKAKTTVDDTKVELLIRVVSKRIDALMGSPRTPYFAPNFDVRKYLLSTKRVDNFNNVFWLNEHILAFSVVTRGGETITANVELYDVYNDVPKALRITSQATTWYNCGTSADTPPIVIQVTGTWGWHEDFSNAFDSVDTVQDGGGINASVTAITVADADGTNSDGFAPRFSPGNLIQIGTELIDVLAVDTTTNVLTVKRGVNGSTAVVHANATAIGVYILDERVKRATARQVALLYARRGAFQVETLNGIGAITYPQDLLTELLITLQDFQYA